MSGRHNQMSLEPCISFYILGRRDRKKSLLTIFSGFAQTQTPRIVITLSHFFSNQNFTGWNMFSYLTLALTQLLSPLSLNRCRFSQIGQRLGFFSCWCWLLASSFKPLSSCHGRLQGIAVQRVAQTARPHSFRCTKPSSLPGWNDKSWVLAFANPHGLTINQHWANGIGWEVTLLLSASTVTWKSDSSVPSRKMVFRFK